jgi:hypothetical protein
MTLLPFSVNAEDVFYLPVTIQAYPYQINFYVKNTKNDFVSCDLKMIIETNDGMISKQSFEIIHLRPDWSSGAKVHGIISKGKEIIKAEAIAECYYF